jgi:hypothetical protein
VSKIINAPLSFVYNWCTDYREDDPKLTKSGNQRKILQKTKQRAVYLSIYRRDKKWKYAVNIVTLHPPNSWHLDFVGEEDYETGEYRLSRIGAHKTKLQMIFKEKYRIRNAPTKAEDTKQTDDVWDKYVAALEKDYKTR